MIHRIMTASAVVTAMAVGSFLADPVDAAEFDVAGVALGMTAEEAEVALKSYDDAISLQKRMSAFRYTTPFSGIQQTDRFLQTIVGEIRSGADVTRIQVAFSPPPAGGRVIGVRREHQETVAPTSMSDYREALIEKYGAPFSEKREEVQAGPRTVAYLTMEWRIGGGDVQCVSSPEGFGMSSIDVLGTITNSQGDFWVSEASDISDCATFIFYRLGNDPVTNATGMILDVEGAGRAELAAQEWIEQLQNEAGQPGTKKPKL